MTHMLRRWLRWIAPVVIALSLGLADAPAQPIEVQRGHGALPRDKDDDGSRTAALPYTVAAISAILVMLLVCTPTRKA